MSNKRRCCRKDDSIDSGEKEFTFAIDEGGANSRNLIKL